jgi:hypothetical protein
MEAGTLRPVGAAPPPAPSRLPDPPAAIRTDLPPEATVRQSGETPDTRDRDSRGGNDARHQSDIALANGRRREIENDAATGLTVMKVIEETSGDVVDQIPADAYLRMKVALQSVLAADSSEPHALALDA